MENKKPFYLEQAAIRLVREPPLYSDLPLDSPQAVVKLLAELLKDYDREVFVIVNLRPDLKPINLNIVSIGALDQAMAHPREILKTAVLSNSASIMMVHNHTTGRVSPSKEDIRVTDRMSKICDLIGIKLLDHLIVGPGENYYSFYEKQQMPLSGLRLVSDLEEIKLEGMKVAETATFEKQRQTAVSFTVAECSEFHNMGELHENVPTMKEAIGLFRQIPPDRMHGIPAMGVRVTDPANPELFTEIDIVTGKVIDLEVLEYVPEIANNKAAQYAIAEMLHEFSGAEIRGEVPDEIQKKVQVLESRERQEAQLKEITDKLEKGVQDVFASDDYKMFLNVMAKMPSYSINNLILIAMQTNGKASMCQSFTGWKQMGRYVKQGEKGIKILAPAPYTIQKENDKIDQSGKPVLDADGEAVKEKKDITINAFKVVSTFDISQTDGKEMPSMGVNELVGNIEGYSSIMKALEEVCPVTISFENIEGGAKGYYHKIEKRIAIQEGMSEVQTVKTAIHEMAHQKLHAIEKKDMLDAVKSRGSKEVEAESVAYVVCQYYGINTSDYSFFYVASWSKGREISELRKSLEIIRNSSADMITSIDNKLRELLAEKNKVLVKKAFQEEITDEQTSWGMVSELVDKNTKIAEINRLTIVDEQKGTQKEIANKKPSVKKKVRENKEKVTKVIEKEVKRVKKKEEACV